MNWCTALDNALRSAGFEGLGPEGLSPQRQNDERRIYAPDPNPPKRHLDPGHGLSTVVRVDVWEAVMEIQPSRQHQPIASGRCRRALHPGLNGTGASASPTAAVATIRPRNHPHVTMALAHCLPVIPGSVGEARSPCPAGRRPPSCAGRGACGQAALVVAVVSGSRTDRPAAAPFGGAISNARHVGIADTGERVLPAHKPMHGGAAAPSSATNRNRVTTRVTGYHSAMRRVTSIWEMK